MNFQQPATTTANTTVGFSFGLPVNAAATPIGAVAPSAAATAAKPSSFSFGATGGGDAGAAKPISFGLGTVSTSVPTTTSAPAAVGLGGFLGVSGANTTAVVAPNISNPVTTPAAVPSFGFGAAPTTTNVIPTAAAVAPALTQPKTTAPPILGLGMSATAPTATTGAGFANLSTATKTTDSATVVNASQMSYNQLEEHINKWTLELEEQEKVFTDQATQINAWDKILIGNNQKILELNDAVHKVKSDQQTLEQELEFIATQHKELEESIVPLQKEFMQIPQVDVERSQTYLLVENLDTQLKQMSEDLKEIIDNLNESNKGQDNTDPIIQIGKILNAHMSSLQWIESSSSNITNKLEDITKMHESFKRDSERSFRSAYYN